MKKLLILTLCVMSLTVGAAAQDTAGARVMAGVLTPETMWKMGRVGEMAVSPDGRRVVYGRTDYDVAANRGTTSLWVQDLPAPRGASKQLGRLTQITDANGSAGNVAWSADGLTVYYLSEGQIWSVGAGGGDAVQLSDIEGGVEYFGIAPTGDKIWYVRRVEVDPKASSKIYPDLDKSAARVYDDLMVRHWDRWTDGTRLHIFVADFDAAAIGVGGYKLTTGTDIMAGEPWDAPMEPYFDAAEIAWSNGGTMLAYTCKKLTGADYAVSTDSDIYVYNLVNGSTTNICKLHGQNEMSGYDKYPVWSPDDSRIAFRSMRRPGNEADKERLMAYSVADHSFVDLTAGFDHSAMNVVWSGENEILFVAPYFGTQQLCRVDMKGNVKVITDGDFDVTAFSLAAGRVVATITRQDRAAELFTIDLKTGRVVALSHVNDDIFAGLTMGRIERRYVKTTDGKDMLTWVTYPPNFDPGKKYPTLLYCEGGPQSAMTQGWSYRWNYQLMAAQGYIVVAPCRRGTLSFGQEWTDQISGDYSGQNIRDYLAAIDELAKEPYVDADRLGCVGASYGGYSAFYLAGVHEGRFKAFIAHCGIFNFESMYGETEELFFVNNDYGGPYWDSSNAVAVRSYAHSPHRLVQNWDTPILIITGERDYRIPYTQSIEAHTAARLLGLDSRLVVFENEAHQVFQPQNNLAWNREFFGWLDKYLK